MNNNKKTHTKKNTTCLAAFRSELTVSVQLKVLHFLQLNFMHYEPFIHLLLTPSSLTSDALKFQSPGLYANLLQDALLQEYCVY